MNASELLRSLQEEGVQLWCEGEELRYRAPRGVLSAGLIKALAARKQEIIQLLSAAGPCFQAWNPPPSNSQEAYPLSFAQQRMWFLKQLEPDSCSLNVALGFSLNGALDVPALEGSLSELIDRHEAFRTTSAAKESQPLQIIVPAGATRMPLEIVDLQTISESEREPELQRLITLEARLPFALGCSPLLHAKLFRFSGDRHVLLLTTHHFVVDGWSVGVMLRDLSALYDANANGRPPSLPPLTSRYCDYAIWQRERLKGKVLEELLSYWKAKLGDAAELNLPTDRPMTPSPSGQGATHRFNLPSDLSEALKVLSRREGVTLFTTLLAAFKALLSRYTGQNDIVVGTAVSDRCMTETQALVGCFANTLVLRTQCDGDPTFGQLLHRVHVTAIEAFDHQDMPFDVLVEQLSPERLHLRNPLFRVSFLLHQHADDQSLKLNGLAIQRLPIELGTSRFDLLLEFQNQGDQLSGVLEYSADLFDPTTIERMVRHFEILLGGMLREPDCPVGRVAMLTEPELRQVTKDWNQTASPSPAQRCVHEEFERQARLQPNAPAVVGEGGTLSYGELHDRSGRLAEYLRDEGITAGSRVALGMDRSLEMIVGMLAVLKAGGVYVPLDPGYPAERLALLLNEVEASLILTVAEVASFLPQTAARVICLNKEWSLIESHAARIQSTSGAPTAVSSGDLAYVIFTSGSTGTPKGVAVPHRAITRLVLNTNYLELGPQDRIAHLSNVCFDAATFEIWGALLNGACVVLVPKAIALDPERFAAELHRHEVSTLFLTTALFNELATANSRIFQGVKQVLFGGEAVNPEPVRRVLEGGGSPGRLLHVYGPTECTTFATFYPVTHVEKDAATIPIGRPISNTTAYVLDKHGNPLPVGVPGELYLGGPGLAQGYLNEPELTRERFVDSPFAADSTERLYRTGDIVKYLADGNIEFIGRADGQVKIRGFRIEPGEVEVVLKRHPDLEDAAVLVREDEPGERRLVAYMVTHHEQSSNDWAGFLRQRVPEYMIPSAFVVLDKLPLTPSGKIDRRALPAPERPLIEAYRAPQTPQEQILCEIFAEVLKIEQIGLNDNFFALGGDSILSIVLVSLARRRGLELTPREVFQLQTAGALASAARTPGSIEGSERDAAEAIGEIILTPIMRWLLERRGPIEHFNQSMLLHVPSELTWQSLIQVLQVIIDGHDMLRLRMGRNVRGEWTLHIAPPGTVQAEACLSRVDLAGLEGDAREEAMRAAIREAVDQLNPTAGRILKATWFVGADAGMLSLVIHHLAVDGVSWRILVSDLATAWNSVIRGEMPQIEPVGTPFRVWAQHLTGLAETSELMAELPAWEAIIHEGGALVPGAVLDPTRDTFASSEYMRVEVSSHITSALLTSIPAAFHAQINDVLLGALVIAIAGWRKELGHRAEGPVLVNLEGHGREALDKGIDLSRTVGWFTSLFPVRLDPGPIDMDEAFAGGPAVARAIKRIKEQLRAVPGQGLGYGLLRYLNPESQTRLAPYREAQISFNYFGRFVTEEAKDWSLTARLASFTGGTDPTLPLAHLIDVNALTLDSAKGPCLSASWRWASALLTESEVRSLAEGWRRALEALVHHVEERGAGGHTPSDFPLVPLSLEQVEHLESAYPDLEGILPLSPLQEGLLFHALYDQSMSDAYCVQLVMEFEGPLDAARMQRAVKAVLRRHANLRVAFRQDGLDHPVQVILRDPAVPWREEDLSSLDAESQEVRRQEFLATDLAERFEPSEAPLLRFALLRLGRERQVFVLTCHHMLLDGWSVQVLLSELLALYRNDRHAASLPPVRPYSEYLAWLARQSSGVALATWRDYLADLDGPTLLAPWSRQGTSSTVTGRWQSDLPGDISDRLKELTRERCLTLSTVIQGLWAVLLGRLSGREDVVFGVTVSGRPAELPAVERMLGLFINTLPLRVRLNPKEPLAALLSTIQESQARLFAFQYVSLAEIKQQAKCGELFDTLVVFENYPLDDAARTEPAEGLRLSDIQVLDATHYPVALIVIPRERLRLRLNYDPARIERATAETFATHFLRLLDQAMTTPDLPIGELSLLTKNETKKIVVDWNRTAAPYPADRCVHEEFERQARLRPEALAVVAEAGSLSYRELNERSERLAGYLRSRGIVAGSRVALCMDRSTEMIVGMLAVLKGGGTYVPLDPAYPAERQAFILNDIAAPVILTVSEAVTTLPAVDATVICLDKEWSAIESDKAGTSGREEARPEVRPKDPAYVIFTSGSTGTPKGVVVPHRAIMRLILNTNYVELGTRDRIAHLSNVCFDAATFEIWGALLTGACVVVIPKTVVLNPRRFAAELERRKVSTVFVTTALFNELAAVDGRIFQSVRQVLFGGEAVNPRSVRQVLQSGGPPQLLLHVYGPTECTTFATFYPVTQVQENAATVPIGRPISNTTAYVLDKQGNPLPAGFPGELYLGGPGVAEGYLHQPELTRERFVPDPFGPDKTERLYRTGDIVKYLPDGNIEFMGRADSQTKIRGFRIEPGEIEAVLQAHPAVENAVVVAREEKAGQRQLVGYVVAKDDNFLSGWRTYLEEKLPFYMIPSRMVRVPELPTTPSGKIDRLALPQPERQNERDSVALSPFEEMIAAVWSDVLEVKAVAPHESFFELGGHSLLATRVVSQLRSRFGVEIPLRVIFDNPTLAEMGRFLEKFREESHRSELPRDLLREEALL